MLFFLGIYLPLHLALSTFDFFVLHKIKKDTRDKILKLVEDKGYIFDKHYYDQIFKVSIKHNKYKFDKNDLLTDVNFCNTFIPFAPSYLMSYIKYISGNYDSFIYSIYEKHYKFIKNNADEIINIWKTDYLTVDPTFKYKKKLEDSELSQDEQLVNLIDKYEDNKDKSDQIIINRSDDLDVLLDKVNELEDLIKSKQNKSDTKNQKVLKMRKNH